MGGDDELVIVRLHSENEGKVVAENDAGVELHADVTGPPLEVGRELSLDREDPPLVGHAHDREVGVTGKPYLFRQVNPVDIDYWRVHVELKDPLVLPLIPFRALLLQSYGDAGVDAL